jgi:hypothetical protein
MHGPHDSNDDSQWVAHAVEMRDPIFFRRIYDMHRFLDNRDARRTRTQQNLGLEGVTRGFRSKGKRIANRVAS